MDQREPSQPDLFVHERRDAASRERLIARIIAEYDAWGGLALTHRQAQQLFDVDDNDRFRRILQELIGRGVIKIEDGLIVRGHPRSVSN